MKRRQRKDATETRQRLLAAAARVFAAKGFWEATHSEICREARANTAAVNYHFGSKENLYVEAWKYSFERSVEAHPPEGGVPPEAPVRERLHGRILAFMQRIADPDNYEIEILHKEMANPTGLLTEAVQQAMERMRQGLRSIVQELLGEGAGEPQVSFCVMSLVGQCFGPMLRRRHVRMGRGTPPPVGPPFAFRVEELAEHVTQFSLAGIRGIRENMNRTQKSTKRSRRNVKAPFGVGSGPQGHNSALGSPSPTRSIAFGVPVPPSGGAGPRKRGTPNGRLKARRQEGTR